MRAARALRVAMETSPYIEIARLRQFLPAALRMPPPSCLHFNCLATLVTERSVLN